MAANDWMLCDDVVQDARPREALQRVGGQLGVTTDSNTQAHTTRRSCGAPTAAQSGHGSRTCMPKNACTGHALGRLHRHALPSSTPMICQLTEIRIIKTFK